MAHSAAFAAVRPKLDFHRSPLLVFYEVTQACDLACQHCRACAQPCPLADELAPHESRQLLEQLAEFPAPPILVLTGGDPLKRADLFELIEHGVALGLEVAVTPSATPLVTPSAVRRLREAGVSRLAISIDGADAETHDALRGVPGSFTRSLEILDQAREAGLSLQVNTTVTPNNLRQIDVMADLFAAQKIALWSVFFLVPVGRALTLPRLSAAECETAFARLWRQSQRQPYAIKTTEAPHYRRFVAQHKSSGAYGDAQPAYAPWGVNDGKGILFVSHAGAIYPSGFLPLACGRFPRDHVVRIYQDSLAFQALRDPDLLEGKCGLCEFRKLCGGSRARAFALTGNLFAEEPDCAYLPAARSSGAALG